MKKVNVLIEEAGQYNQHEAYLVTNSHVVYFSNNSLKFLRVKAMSKDEYMQDGGHVNLGENIETDNPEELIKEVVEKMVNISFLDYLINYYKDDTDINFGLVK